MSEYLLVMHELQKARLADQARKAGAEPDGRRGMIRHKGRISKIKARFGFGAREESATKGATK